MKSTGKPQVLNKPPTVTISHKDLAAINHVIALAPKEAQWFHQVERVGETSSVTVKGLYIPEQWCSGAEVESDPEMFISMYRELLEEHGPDETNDILKSMTAWCHSHHNMPCNPSGQDIKQFTEQCTKAIEDGVTTPQLMFIFNKRDEYYCRLWDPLTGLMFENVDFLVEDKDYDFSWIDEQAKAKFKQKKIQSFATHSYKTWLKNNKKSTSPNSWTNGANYNRQTMGRHVTSSSYGTYSQTVIDDVEEYIAAYDSVLPLTSSNSSDRNDAVSSAINNRTWNFEEETQELLEVLRGSNADHTDIEKLITHITTTLSDVEMVYLHSFLTETSKTELLVWCQDLPIPKSSEIQNIKSSLYENLKNNMYDAGQLNTAMKLASLIDEAGAEANSLRINAIINYWHEELDSGNLQPIYLDENLHHLSGDMPDPDPLETMIINHMGSIREEEDV